MFSLTRISKTQLAILLLLFGWAPLPLFQSVGWASTPLSISTKTIKNGQAGKAYSTHLSAQGGQKPRTWSMASGTLSPGLSLNATSGKLTGTPQASGTFSPVFRVTDSLGQTAIREYTFTVQPPDIRGTYNGGASVTQENCGLANNNKTISFSSTLKISRQTDSAITGSLKLTGVVDGSRMQLVAAINQASLVSDTRISGSLTLTYSVGKRLVWTGNGDFTGSIIGKLADLEFSGQISAGESCKLHGVVSSATQPDFDLSVTPLAMWIGQTATISVTSFNSFSSPVGIEFEQLPPGIVPFPTPPFSVIAGQDQQIFFAAENSPTPGDYSVTVRGTSGGLSHSATFTLRVPEQPSLPPVRSTYVRTNTMPNDIVYDPAHKRIFVSVPDLNRVDVVSTENGQRVASIPVPAAMNLELMPDGTTILTTSINYVGRPGTEYIHAIDTERLQVVERIPFPAVPSCCGVVSVPSGIAATSNGTVLLRVGELDRSGFERLLQWNPATGTVVDRTPSPLGVDFLMRSGDYSKVLVISNFAGIIYDAATDTFTPCNCSGLSFALNPNGTQIAVGSGWRITIFDAQLQEIANVPGGAMIYSRDGKFLYAAEPTEYFPAFGVYDTQTFTRIGEVPAVVESRDLIPVRVDATPLAIDEPGTIFSRHQHGVSFSDASAPRSLPTRAPIFARVDPPQGALSSPTAVTMWQQGFSPGASVFFGSEPALSVSPDSLTAIAPPGLAPGPVNVTAIFPNGWSAIAPDGFTYGPHVLTINPTAGPVEGGTDVQIVGYGFGFPLSQIQVTVGGRPATVTRFNGGSIDSLPMFRFEFRTPPGITGPANVTFTTPAGSTTIRRGFTYASAVVVPGGGGSSQLIYDRQRRRVYMSLAGGNRVDVFSLDRGKFLTPLPVGVNPVGLALTPDGAKLLVANYGDKTITIIDPENPTTAVSVSAVEPFNSFFDPRPVRVVATSTGKAFISVITTHHKGVKSAVGVSR